MQETARIVVRRPKGGYRDLLRSYRIEIDGVRVGRISRGQEVEFSVSPGTHQVRAAIDWSGSPVVQVDVADGGTARLVVAPAGSAATAIGQVWSRESWLTLSVE